MTTTLWGRMAFPLTAALCLAGTARAQTSDPGQAQTGQAQTGQPAQPSQPYYGPAPPNAGGAPVGQRVADALAGPGGDQAVAPGPFKPVSDYLGGYGISLRGVLINQYANNPVGGVHQGNDNVGQLNFGFDLDLQKSLGIPGGSFHTTFYRDYGFSLAKDTTGTLVKQQNIYKNAFPQLHAGLFAYEQKALDDRLDIIIGRLGTTAYYAHLIPACDFQGGATCGVPTILNSESGYGLLPSATWGANVTYHFTHEVYFSTGAFEVNPFIQHTNGWDWSTKFATGFTVPFELVWSKPSLKTEAYPFELKFGGYVSTAPHADPYYNTKGQSLGTFGGTALNDQTRDGIYLMGDRVIWRPNRASNENLNVFAAIIQPLEKEETLSQQIYAGAVITGGLPGRPYDTFGVMGSYMQVSPRELELENDARAKLKGTGRSSPDEGVFEVNYGYQIMPYMTLSPNIQYTANPDNSGFTKINFVPKNIVTFGLQLTLGVSKILGFAGLGDAGG